MIVVFLQKNRGKCKRTMFSCIRFLFNIFRKCIKHINIQGQHYANK